MNLSPADQPASTLLVIDTAATTSVAVVAADDDGAGTVLAEHTTDSSTDHAEQLSSTVAAVLAQGDIDPRQLSAIVAGVGPGPFTGLRVGMVAAAAYAFGWSLPIHGVMSLDALALPAATAVAPGTDFLGSDFLGTEFIVAADARRREVYWAHYRQPAATTPVGQPELLAGPFVSPAHQIPDELRTLPAFGPGTALYPEAFGQRAEADHQHGPAGYLGLRAAHLLATAPEQLLAQVPLYLRESDAKIPTNPAWARNV